MLASAMNVLPQIAIIEAALKERGLSVAGLCRKADLAPTTWVRWKNGAPATARSWERISAALGQIDPALPALAERKAEAA